MQNTRLLALNICALFYEIYVDMVTKPVSFPRYVAPEARPSWCAGKCQLCVSFHRLTVTANKIGVMSQAPKSSSEKVLYLTD